MALDAWADVDAAIAAAKEAQQNRIDRLTTFSALLILGGAIWLMWPNLQSAIRGESGLLGGLGYPLVVIAYGLIIQDLVIDNPQSRTRIGSLASIAWPVLLMVAGLNVDVSNASILAAMVCLGIVAFASYRTSKSILRGGLDVLRWRAIMTGLGTVGAFSLLAGSIPETLSVKWLLSMTILATSSFATGYIWFVGDEHRGERRIFVKRLDALESRLLELKANGSAVDQAASLVMTAKEEGHVDPLQGMKLLDEAEEDIERSLSLSGDVEVIQGDALEAIQAAESIAPVVKRPRKSYEMGIREVKLGSLREGEMLFRQSKKLANEIIQWWLKAEQAIAEASLQLKDNDGESVQHLKEMLLDAKKKLANESPEKAYQFAVVIPDQLLADEGAQDRALDAVNEAKKQLKQTDGLDTADMENRLAQAEQAIEAGSPSQAIGLADGVVRSLESEREAMDTVRRALKQRNKLVSQYQNRDDKTEWDDRLTSIETAADDKKWLHASELLNRMTTDLDNEGQASDEALELFDFVVDEWKILRNQCDSANITLEDDDRRSAEKAIALAGETLGVGRIEACLNHLSQADTAMERLRRRI
ncbi:MAG: hypothetical protein CMA63_00940 [Euryarchaeota archaeon]|nr:hypothetical protein [Euryarchaeota archaeon]|tara:strand:+ start:80703 stop:82469 length:1767 start_codon:yes stop_codon:yes gene_type:complete